MRREAKDQLLLEGFFHMQFSGQFPYVGISVDMALDG
jgi:hypothetical protein